MEDIIWQTNDSKMYIKFVNKYVDEYRPFASFIIGVELKLGSAIGCEVLCKGEDGFNMSGGKLLSELKQLINSYQVKKICVKDDFCDTDAYVLFDCKLDHIEISGQLGSTFSDMFTSKFKFRANSSILVNLYEALKTNAIY